ncbi:MAG: SDR family oxidoreductase [Alphaproteobacteria bacterium]
MANPMDDQVAFVTGAGGGLGRAQAVRLAQDGAHVVVHDRDADTAKACVAAIENAGGQAEATIGDVTDFANLRATLEDTERRLGHIDILVNNAGVGGGQSFEDITEEMFDEIFRINAKAPFFAAQAVIPGMKQRGHGRIINISSLVALRGTANNPHYAGSKAALIGFTRCWALEYAPHKICVNTVVPSFIATPMATNAFGADYIAERSAANPMGRLANPEDVAKLVAFLAGPDADFITGQTLSANGGEYINAM